MGDEIRLTLFRCWAPPLADEKVWARQRGACSSPIIRARPRRHRRRHRRHRRRHVGEPGQRPGLAPQLLPRGFVRTPGHHGRGAGSVLRIRSPPAPRTDMSRLASALRPRLPMGYDHYLWYFGSRLGACSWAGLARCGTPRRARRATPGTTPQPAAWCWCRSPGTTSACGTRRRMRARTRPSSTRPSTLHPPANTATVTTRWAAAAAT